MGHNDRAYTVVQWGIGGVGIHSARFVLDRDDLHMVGARCWSEGKAGKDIGTLVGRDPIGVPASNSTQELLDLDADVVVYTPRDPLLDPTLPGSPSRDWVEGVLPILASGKNVVSSIGAGMHWRHLADGEAMKAEIDKACAEGSSSFFSTGIDPGFASDSFALMASSIAGRVEQIRTYEIIDYSRYEAVETIEAIGFGKKPEDLDATAAASVIATWGSAVHLLADGAGVELDELTMGTEIYLAPEDYTAPSGLHIAEGTVGALRWSLTGTVQGKPRFVVNHVNRVGSHMAPDWVQIGTEGGYRVEVDAYPPISAEIPLGMPGGTGYGLDDAMVNTAARVVNSIDAVVNARPGFLTPADLPPVGPRHALRQGRE